MTDLSENDLNDWLKVGRLANDCTSFDELQAVTLRLLEQVYQTSGCIFGLCKGDSFGDVTMERFAERGLSQDYITLYVSKYRRFDILTRSIRENSGIAPPKVMTAAQSVSYDKFTRCKIYREYFSRFSIHHILCINLISRKRPFGVIALYRPRQDDGFSPCDLIKAKLIASSLSGTAHSMLYREKLTDQIDVTDALSSGFPCCGVVVLDAGLLPLYMDARARNIFSVLLPRKNDDGHLSQSYPDELRRCCKELLAAAASGTRGLQESNCEIRIPRTSQCITCHVRIIQREEKAPLFLVNLETKAPPVGTTERMRGAGLTPREMDVVLAVSSGLTNREIADALWISVSTVQTHLRSIYDKLRVRNRTGLIHYFIKLK